MKGSGLVHMVLLGAGLTFVPTSSIGQTYPERPVRLVVAQSAGSNPDIVARTVASKLSDMWKHPMVVDNRPGANGIIGGEVVVRSKPDGYTLLLGVASALAMNQFIYKKIPYDPVKDLAPITQLATNTFGMFIPPTLPAKSVKELVALARMRPGEMSFGSAGVGNQTHLAGELFAIAAGVRMLHVPYKGSTPAFTDLMGGQIALLFNAIQPGVPHVKTGRLRLLATCGEKRFAPFPDVPTLIEAGYPGLNITGWNGFLAPRATPQAIINQISQDVARVLDSRDIREFMSAGGAEPTPSTPEAYQALIHSEVKKWIDVIRKAGLEFSQ
jgi:tripartite-type tricarboxylate transporter receptor subunit TctC